MLTWAVTAKTAARYTNAAERFVQWVTDTGDDAATAADFDALLVEYCQFLFESGHGKSLASMTLSGLLHFCPWLVHELPIWHVVHSRVGPSVARRCRGHQ